MSVRPTIDEEHACIRMLQAGNVAGLRQLYEWFSRPLYGAVLSKGVPPSVAEEIVHDTFARVWERIDDIQLDQRSVFGWIRRIGVNRSHDLRRRQGKVVVLHPTGEPAVDSAVDSAVDAQALDPVLAQEQSEMIQETLAVLSQEQAEIIRLRFLERHPPAEVAERLGITQNNVNVRLFRALAAFCDGWPPR